MSDLVASPMWAALNELCTSVQQNLTTVADALKDADQRMEGGNGGVWVGPTARQWGGQLTSYSGDLNRQANGFLHDVQAQLASQPKEVTREQAHTEDLILSGRIA